MDEESAGKELGVVFKSKAGGDTWPKVQRIDSGPVQAVTPQLRVGCTLISINGVSVDGMLFNDAAPMTKVRPLEFIWQEPEEDPIVAVTIATTGAAILLHPAPHTLAGYRKGERRQQTNVFGMY